MHLISDILYVISYFDWSTYQNFVNHAPSDFVKLYMNGLQVSPFWRKPGEWWAKNLNQIIDYWHAVQLFTKKNILYAATICRPMSPTHGLKIIEHKLRCNLKHAKLEINQYCLYLFSYVRMHALCRTYCSAFYGNHNGFDR